jgi:arabinoxylan arabinofuranohydrolase
MRLKTGKVVSSIFEARNTLTQRTEGEKCSGAITVDLSNMAEGDCAGLAAFCAQEGTLTIQKNAEGKTLSMTDRGKVIEQISLNQDVVSLRIDFDFTCDKATFHYSLDGKEWSQLGEPLKMVYNLVHFMGYRFGIFNYATKQAGGYIDVDNFAYSRQEKQVAVN